VQGSSLGYFDSLIEDMRFQSLVPKSCGKTTVEPDNLVDLLREEEMDISTTQNEEFPYVLAVVEQADIVGLIPPLVPAGEDALPRLEDAIATEEPSSSGEGIGEHHAENPPVVASKMKEW
jgi:hypothetical protein